MAIDTIKSVAIFDGSVATADIADDAVTSAKLGSGAVDTTALGTDAVTTAKIAASQVTNAKIANSTLDLTAKVTGALPVANGGTALTSGFINGGITQSSAVSTSGAANYNITGIPTTAQKIIVNLYLVKPAASGTTRYLEWRLIDESGNQVNSTTYFNHQEYSTGGGSANISYSNAVNSFRLNGWSNENNIWYGNIVFDYYTGFGNDIWQMTGNLWTSGFTNYLLSMSGFCSGAGANPSGVRLMTSTGGNFDSGQFTVSYI